MQVHKVRLTVGSRGAGNVWVDAGGVRGEGGPTRPQIVVPLMISLESTPAGAQLALGSLRASLSTTENFAPQTIVSSPVAELPVYNFPVRSFPSGSLDHQITLRFVLSAAEVETLEANRHATRGEVFTLYLKVDAIIGVLTTHNEVPGGTEPIPTPWDFNYGMFSEFAPFWNTEIGLVRFSVEQSTWVRDVLPGLGYDRRRLIELNFPPPLPDHKSAAKEWDKARNAFDGQRYGDCISECRDLLAMWGRQLGATKARPLARVIAERGNWTATDKRIGFLDGLWKAATDLANVPHHPEADEDDQDFAPNDARLVLLLTAALCEYVSSS